MDSSVLFTKTLSQWMPSLINRFNFPPPRWEAFCLIVSQCGGVEKWILINNWLMHWHFSDWHSRPSTGATRNRWLTFPRRSLLSFCHFFLSFFLSLTHSISLLRLSRFFKSIFCLILLFMFSSCVSSLYHSTTAVVFFFIVSHPHQNNALTQRKEKKNTNCAAEIKTRNPRRLWKHLWEEKRK